MAVDLPVSGSPLAITMLHPPNQRTISMFRAICKFAQFRNCVAQRNCVPADFEIVLRFYNCHPISKLRCAISKSRNFNTHTHFQNCARACHLRRVWISAIFDRFCVEQFKDRDVKTISTERTTNCGCHQERSIISNLQFTIQILGEVKTL